MRTTFLTIFGLVVLNAVMLYYERQGLGQGWRIYLGLAGITLLAALSLPLGLMLLIPITGYNILVNTGRIRQKLTQGGTEE